MTTLLLYLALGVVGLGLLFLVALIYVLAMLLPVIDGEWRDARGGTDGR